MTASYKVLSHPQLVNIFQIPATKCRNEDDDPIVPPNRR